MKQMMFYDQITFFIIFVFQLFWGAKTQQKKIKKEKPRKTWKNATPLESHRCVQGSKGSLGDPKWPQGPELASWAPEISRQSILKIKKYFENNFNNWLKIPRTLLEVFGT